MATVHAHEVHVCEMHVYEVLRRRLVRCKHARPMLPHSVENHIARRLFGSAAIYSAVTVSYLVPLYIRL